MKESERRYDIDWLRVIAIGLLLVYHIAIGFQPWGVFIGFIQNNDSIESIWIPMSMLNVWRIPLLFFVSGMGVGFAMRRRNLGQLILERSRRILIPFIFGVFTVVPLHLLIWKIYYKQELAYTPATGHLWFLAYIFLYVILLSPLFLYLKNKADNRFNKVFRRIYSNPIGLLMISLAFIAEAMILNPETYEMYAMTKHGFLLGLLAFFFGFTFINIGNEYLETSRKWRWMYLSSALALYLVRLFVFDLKAPIYLFPVETILWILAVTGFAGRYLNRPGPALNYLSQGAYPIYIIHMVFLYIASFLVFPLDIHAWVKFIVVIVLTGAGCFIVYDLIITRIGFIRPLFGLKPGKNT
jgi:peptidoglycan/LPS O-acetylase OafA/YrhL